MKQARTDETRCLGDRRDFADWIGDVTRVLEARSERRRVCRRQIAAVLSREAAKGLATEA